MVVNSTSVIAEWVRLDIIIMHFVQHLLELEERTALKHRRVFLRTFQPLEGSQKACTKVRARVSSTATTLQSSLYLVSLFTQDWFRLGSVSEH